MNFFILLWLELYKGLKPPHILEYNFNFLEIEIKIGKKKKQIAKYHKPSSYC